MIDKSVTDVSFTSKNQARMYVNEVIDDPYFKSIKVEKRLGTYELAIEWY